jgi:hypothetical protein
MTAFPYGLACLIGLSASSTAFATNGWMPSTPGSAHASLQSGAVTLENQALRLVWNLEGSQHLRMENRWAGSTIDSDSAPFRAKLRGGQWIPFGDFRETAPLHLVSVSGGQAAEERWTDESLGLSATWRITLRDGSNYIRTELDLTPAKQDVDLEEVDLIDVSTPDAKVSGSVQGSPIVTSDIFFGFEHPMALATVTDGLAVCGIQRALPLHAGQTTRYSSVIGVSPRRQLRRGFLNYVERERARRYDTFLHYNSWYDLGYFNRYTADQCVERINTYGQELSVKRGVKLSSFLFDDGWDDPHTIWKFNANFPNAFTPLKEAAEKYHANPGIWLSPWGGYAEPREQRLATGKKEGMEIDSEGFALSGPKYYDLFRNVCLKLVGEYGINQFKFDGTGSPDKQYPGSKFGSDFEAAIQLIQDLRKARPGLFVNLTTGTWPSPFWTRYADSIWRGGYDHNFAGVGPSREKWITYRDGDTYHGIVLKGPLYPLNSLMLHGLIYAQYAQGLKNDPQNDFRNELRDYFGTGTQLQEMYITPSLLTPQNWDDLAESAKWSRANKDTLVDTHWVGGDPLKLEVYGWASWSPQKAILVLRNPSDQPQAFSVDPEKVFELPENSHGTLNLKDPYKSDHDNTVTSVKIGESKVIHLAPSQVVVLEGAGR